MYLGLGNNMDHPGGSYLRNWIKQSVVPRAPRDDEWTIEEVAQAVDRGLALFYSKLNDYDRVLFEREHIAVNGDFRPWL